MSERTFNRTIFMSSKIEQMQLQDLEIVARLSEQLGYPNTMDKMTERFLRLKNLKDHALFVAKENNQVVGWAHVSCDAESLLAEPRAELHALVVDETQRSCGHGQKLLEAAEKWARAQGLTLLRLRSNVKRTEAHRFYQREGYSIQKSWHLFVKGLS